MNSQPLMLDVDTGIDDAAAIAFAVGAGADLVGVTTVAGNCAIDLATDNTLRVLSHLGAETVPVFRGASRPLAASLHHAPYMHGDDGLGGANLPPADVEEQELTAPEAIVAMAEEFAGELVFVSMGPMTNLAIAMSLRPQIVRQIARVVIMGGAYFNPGNRTPYAEFNAYIDPDALHQVFQAEWNEIYAIGLDVTHQVEISPEIWNAIPQDAGGTAGLVRAVSKSAIEGATRDRFFLHDPLAVGVGLDPSLVTAGDYSVRVETTGERRGQTIVEQGGNVRVASEVNGPLFMRQFCDAVDIPRGGEE
jgi:purine nucleosidase